MANNIKYIRWAAKVLKVIMGLNILVGVVLFLTPLFQVITSIRPGSFSIEFGILITTALNAFYFYTGARGLELLADIAHHILATWHRQNQPETDSRSFFQSP